MDKETFSLLNRGDIVRHKSVDCANSYVVVANHGSRVTAIDIMEMTNPGGWNLVYKAKHEKYEAKPPCRNCQDPRPGKRVYVTVRGPTSQCIECGRLLGTKEEGE